MKPGIIFGACLAWALFGAGPASALDVTMDTASARAVLTALKNPSLSRQDALEVARLPGNQGLIQKATSYKVAASTEAFADALVAAAHGTPLDTPTAQILRFDHLQTQADRLADLLSRIEMRREDFLGWVIERVRRFSPAGASARIEGFLVIGGNSGGFAFEDPKFYLNLDYFNEFEPAKVVLAHELYHAIQNVYSVDSEDRWLKPERPGLEARRRQEVCANLANLFTNLYQEGSASYVGDPLLIDRAGGPFSMKLRSDFEDGLHNLRTHRTLLELAVVGLQAKDAVPYDDIYALGFNVPEPLYKLGYVMAKAVVSAEGPEGLARFLDQPGYVFARHYTQLPHYGEDHDHPALGPHTMEALRQLAAGCP